LLKISKGYGMYQIRGKLTYLEGCSGFIILFEGEDKICIFALVNVLKACTFFCAMAVDMGKRA
jgi:hypothetical protein